MRGARSEAIISSTAIYGLPERHPVPETAPLAGVGPYGRSKIEAEAMCAGFAARGLEHVTLRPKTFLGPERLGVFEILFDWVHGGRRIYVLGDGTNRSQLLAVRTSSTPCHSPPAAGKRRVKPSASELRASAPFARISRR